MKIKNITSRISKTLACMAAIAILLALLIGMGAPVQAKEPDVREAGSRIEIQVQDLSAIPDGYDAANAGVAYIIPLD